MRQQVDACFQSLLCFRFVVRVKAERVRRIDLFQTKALAVRHAKRFGVFLRLFEKVFHSRKSIGPIGYRTYLSAKSSRSSRNPRRIASNAGSLLISGIGTFPRAENQMMRFNTSGSAI